MNIDVRLNVVMAEKKMRLNEPSKRIGISEVNLSILKNNKAKAIRFSTLEALCKELECQPGDLLKYIQENNENESKSLSKN